MLVQVKYRSDFKGNWLDRRKLASSESYIEAFCRPVKETNGLDWYNLFSKNTEALPGSLHQTADIKPTDIILPESLKPRLEPLTEGYKAMQFYQLEDKTGVLVMGDFGQGQDDELSIRCELVTGLHQLHDRGAKNLIIDLVSTTLYSATKS